MKTCKDCENFLIFKDYEEGIVYQTCKAEKETPQVDCALHKSAQQSMHLTAFGAWLAWLFFGFVLLLAMVLIIIGGR